MVLRRDGGGGVDAGGYGVLVMAGTSTGFIKAQMQKVRT